MGEAELAQIGLSGQPKEVVLRLARLAQSCGLVGVVCSAQEAQMLKQECGRDFCLVTPGIRPAQAGVDDQKRVMTPEAAIANGADYLVIGRPITRAEDPLAALLKINQGIAGE
jgi:orotidine-5'-phosphate decarboxylase